MVLDNRTSLMGTTLGKKVLDRINDRVFFSWTQGIMLAVGLLIILDLSQIFSFGYKLLNCSVNHVDKGFFI